MELEENSSSETSAAFLEQLRGRLNVIWDNSSAHRGQAVREYLRRPGLNLRLMDLPGYSPDFNADEAIWGWAREEVTGDMYLGSKAAVRQRVGSFLTSLAVRKDEVRRRCNQRSRNSCEIPSPIPTLGQMHIPPRLCFSLLVASMAYAGVVTCIGDTFKRACDGLRLETAARGCQLADPFSWPRAVTAPRVLIRACGSGIPGPVSVSGCRIAARGRISQSGPMPRPLPRW